MDDAAGGKKEKSFEESMGHQMEDASGKRADAAGQEHVAKLADGGIGKHSLDVCLDQAGR